MKIEPGEWRCVRGPDISPSAVPRRQFLQAGAITALAYLFPAPLSSSADKPQKFKIGMAATTWLSSVPSIDSYWNAAAAIGDLDIGATEADNSAAKFDTHYGGNVEEFQRHSLRLGVQLKGVYQALYLHDSQKLDAMRAKMGAVASFLKAAGAEYIALGWDVPDAGGKPYQRTPEDVRQAVRSANVLGRIALEDHGMPVSFHAERDIPKEMILRILDETSANYVQLCADVGHLTAAGLDALEVVKNYRSRLAVCHWKDFDPKLAAPGYLGPGAKGDFVEVGKGVVDFRALANFYRESGLEGWVQLELDRTRESSIEMSAREMKAFVSDELKLQFFSGR